MQDPPFYNEEWGFKNGAQNDIFDLSEEVAPVKNVKQHAVVQEEKAPSATKEVKEPTTSPSSSSQKPTPATSSQKVEEAMNSPSDDAHTEIAMGFAREAIVTQTIVVTRTHLVVVTEEASPVSSKRTIKRSKRQHKRRMEALQGISGSRPLST